MAFINIRYRYHSFWSIKYMKQMREEQLLHMAFVNIRYRYHSFWSIIYMKQMLEKCHGLKEREKEKKY